MFPFAGMTVWRKYVGEGLRWTHYMRSSAPSAEGSTLPKSGNMDHRPALIA